MKVIGIVVGALIGVAGLIAFLLSGSEHSFCSSTYVFEGATACRAADAFYHGGIIAMVLGLGLVLCSLVAPSKRRRLPQ